MLCVPTKRYLQIGAAARRQPAKGNAKARQERLNFVFNILFFSQEYQHVYQTLT